MFIKEAGSKIARVVAVGLTLYGAVEGTLAMAQEPVIPLPSEGFATEVYGCNGVDSQVEPAKRHTIQSVYSWASNYGMGPNVTHDIYVEMNPDFRGKPCSSISLEFGYRVLGFV